MKWLIPFLFLTTTASASFSGYTYERTITISSTNVSNTLGTISNLPVLISTNDNSLSTTTASGGRLNSTGFDLVFSTKSDCSFLLNWDTETVMNVGVSTMNVWVKVPVLTTATLTAATFYMCYGNAGVTTYQGVSTNTWDSNYVGVYHLANGSTLSVADATGKTAPTNNGASATTGQVDGAASFNGTSNYLDTNSSSMIDAAQNITLSAWINFSNITNFNGLFTKTSAFNESTAKYALETSGSQLRYNQAGGDLVQLGSITTNTLYYITITNNASASNIYINGALNASGASLSAPTTSVDTWKIGTWLTSTGGWVAGMMDEARISNVARSSDWILTEYNNQNSPQTFASIGSETTSGNGPVISNNQGLIIQGGKMTIKGGKVVIQ